METLIMSLVIILLNNGNTHNDPREDFTETLEFIIMSHLLWIL